MSETKTISPFGPNISILKIPEELIDELNYFCDEVVKNEQLAQSLDHSEYLVGKVSQEIQVPNEILENYSDFFQSAIEKYMKDFAISIAKTDDRYNYGPDFNEQAIRDKTQVRSKFISGWIVRSFKGDYNPLHNHPHATLACVGYLKVPDWQEEIDEDAYDHSGLSHGCLSLKYGDMSSLSTNSYNILPEVGNLYLFPGWLQHTVYPFKSEGERRSFSINFGAELVTMQVTLRKSSGESSYLVADHADEIPREIPIDKEDL